MSEKLTPPFDYSRAIQDLINKAKLKQSYIAAQIGLTQGRVSQIYSGIDAKGMRYDSCYKLSQLCVEHDIETNPAEEAEPKELECEL